MSLEWFKEPSGCMTLARTRITLDGPQVQTWFLQADEVASLSQAFAQTKVEDP